VAAMISGGLGPVVTTTVAKGSSAWTAIRKTSGVLNTGTVPNVT
jgi:hypothetical protein